MSLRTKIGAGLMALLPVVTLAEPGATYNNYFEGVAASFTSVINIILPAMIGLVIVGFAWGLFVYIKGGAEDKEKGKSIMIWGGLAVIVVLSLYGLANLLQKITGATGTIVNVPSTATGLKQQ